jgi:hypothetical protein
MDKLSALKKYFTLEETCRYFSKKFCSDISISDLLHIAIEGRLTLSINLFYPAIGKAGCLVPIASASFTLIEQPSAEPWKLYNGTVLLKDGKEHSVIEWSDTLIPILGLYDFLMLGSEKVELQKIYLESIGLPSLKVVEQNFEGIILLNRLDVPVQLQIPPTDDAKKKIQAIENEGFDAWQENHSPKLQLPDNSMLVIRTEVIHQFVQNTLLSKKEQGTPTERAASIAKRVNDEKKKGIKNCLQVVAKEEGVSVSRIKQLVAKTKKPLQENKYQDLIIKPR